MSSVFPPGVQLATRYRVLRLLETNHVGALYEAERFEASHSGDGKPRSVTGRRVALKWLRFAAGGATQLAHHRAELARKACTVRHPHLALVHDVALEGSSLFVVSELLLGEPLRARLAPHTMPLHERLRALADAMSAVAFAHQRGLVHGGIHPGNLFLHQAHDPAFGLLPVVKVHDFGTATTTLPQSLAYPGERSPFGPHAYLDHAQLCGVEPDARSDIYACAVLLYQALTGSVPFAASSPVELAIKLATVAAAPIGDRQPGLPASLEALIQQALRRERSERPQQLDSLAALTSAYAETLAARALLARGDSSLVTRRMIQPLRSRADAAHLDAQLPPEERDTRPLAVVGDDERLGKVTRLLTVIGAEPEALPQSSASPVPQHTRHPPEYLAALQEAEIAAALELARLEASHHEAQSALPLRHEDFDLRPLVEAPRAPSEPPAAPVARRTERGMAAPPSSDLSHELLRTTMTMAVPLLDPDLVQLWAEHGPRPDGTRSEPSARLDHDAAHRPAAADVEAEPVPGEQRAPRNESSTSGHAAMGPSSARVTREKLEQEGIVEISRHPTVVGSPAQANEADAKQHGYVEVVARTRARPVLQLAETATPSVLEELKHGLLSRRASTGYVAAAAALVVVGISMSFALATHREIAKSAPPALPSVARVSSARGDVDLADERARQLAPQARGVRAESDERTAGPTEVESDAFERRTAALVQTYGERTDGAVRRADSPSAQERRHPREHVRERPQRARAGARDDGYLVGPPPTADQF